MSNNLVMTYRGNITACATQDNQLFFTTIHPEQQPTALYQITLAGSLDETASYQESIYPLPCGANDLLPTDNIVWIAGEDGRLYTQNVTQSKSKLKAVGKLQSAEDPVRRMAKLTEGHLALLHEKQLSVLHCNSGKIVQLVDLQDGSMVLATDPTGQWLAVGFLSGEISVYQFQSSELFFSARSAIHQGRVSAITFEANELRFFSAGADKKLYSTHAQGELQALDKGKSSNHDGVIQEILLGDEHFYTGASDKSIKAWPLSGGRPITINKGLHRVHCLARLNVADKAVLVACGGDNSLRFLPLSSKGEPNEVRTSIRDGYAWADVMLREKEVQDNEQGVKLLAQYDDQKSFEVLARYLQKDSKKPIRQQMIQVAVGSKHPASTKLLETALNDKQHDVVRQAAYQGLVKRIQPNSIRPYTLALQSGYSDIGSQALAALAKLAKKQAQAEQALITALEHENRQLNLLALYHLESVYAKADPKASLHALTQFNPELQRAAIIRLYQRQLLDNHEVQRALLQAQEHNDGWVRQTAFLVAILSQPALADTLKKRDEDLARQLSELENFDLLKPEEASGSVKKTDKPAKPAASLLKKLKQTLKGDKPSQLDESALTPLLQGMTNPHADICFRAGFALALLQDQRAFGLLLLLSQEQDEAIRVGVCRAFAVLQQADALPQLELLLDDKHEGVRDAAFSSITALVDEVWRAVRYGFASQQEDVHRRALKTLLDGLGKSKKIPQAGLELLTQALNDPFDSIRQETFKASFNRQLGGDLPTTLRLLRGSRYENVHREVLNEVLAVLKEEWAQDLLLELFCDEFEAIRQQALTQALKEKKRFDRSQVLAQALASNFVDMRRAAHQQLTTKPGNDDWQLLIKLIDDDDEELRVQALRAVIRAEDTSVLETAMQSRFRATRVQAMVACAGLGMEQAFTPLMEILQGEKPDDKQQLEEWRSEVSQALDGLGALEDKRAFAAVLALATGNEKPLAEAASHVLPWVSDASHIEQLLPLLADERMILRANVALALALLNQQQGLDALADNNTRNHIIAPFTLAAALMQEQVNPASLRGHLSAKPSRVSASFTLLCHELLLNGARPNLSVQALALDNPRLQRLSADLIRQYHDRDACWALLQHYVTQQLNLGDKPQWQIPLADLQQIAAVLVYGDPHVRARLLYLLQMLDQHDTRENWQHHYQAFAVHYASALEQAAQQVSEQQPELAEQSHWQQTAFGAYLGLLRATLGNNRATLNLHLQAINGLSALAEGDKSAQRQGVFSCLLTLLNHQHYVLRHQAYEQLLSLGMPADELGRVATTSHHDDIATLGLNLLVEKYPLKQSRKLLQDMLVTGSQALAQEAYALLLKDEGFGLLKLTPFALKSYHAAIRRQCVNALGQVYDDDSKVAALLLEASQNQQQDVALVAVQKLAQHQHPQTLQQAQAIWHQLEEDYAQTQLMYTLAQWRGEGLAAFLLEALANKATLKINRKMVFYQVGETRDRTVAEALFDLLPPKSRDRKVIIQALHTLSGYDQYIAEEVDSEEVATDRSWLTQQHPRHDDVLIKLFGTLLKLDEQAEAEDLLAGMAWAAENAELDHVLAEAAAVANNDLLQATVETIAIRARRRNGSVAALLQLLTHKDPDIQFLAAEGLGRSGYMQGNSVLLASSEYLDDLYQRQRAVIALGESGDASVLDKLLALAEDKEHALAEAATEAIGHLGNSEQAEKILKLLQQRLKHADFYSDMNERALNGLRWFNTLDAWQAIADFAENEAKFDYSCRHAITLLRYWDSERCRELLLKAIREGDDDDLVETAWESARFLWQVDDKSVTPIDKAVMQSSFNPSNIGDEKTLERVCRYAETSQILDLLAGRMAWRDEDSSWLDTHEIEAILNPLKQTVMQRNDLKAADIAKGLAAERSDTVSLIAHLAGLQAKPVKTVQTALQQALDTRHAIWLQRWQAHERQPDWQNLQKRNTEQQTLTKLFRAAILQQLNSPLLAGCLQSQLPYAIVFHETILDALLIVDKCGDAELLEAVATLTQTPSANIRQLANQVMLKHLGKPDEQGWESFMHQPDVLADKQFNPAIVAAAQSDRHARALPVLIRQQDMAALNNIATDEALDEVQRIGAIEGLGRIQTEAAEQMLQAIHQQSDIDEDIARAAYRTLRRSQRARNKANQIKQGAAA